MDNPEATEAAEATEQTDAAGQEDPPPPTDPAEAAAAEEAAIQAEIIAAENGEAPPPTDGEGETGETETSQEGSEEDSTEAAEGAAAEGGEEAAGSEGGEQPPEDEAADAQDDIWGELSDEQRSALEDLTKKAAAAEQGKRSAEGRESGLKRRLDALMSGNDGQETPAEEPETRQQPSEDERKQARAALSAELKQFADDYPEIAKPLGKALAHLEGNITRLEGEIGKRDAIIQRLEGGLQQIGSERHQANLADQEQVVYEAHPDYDAIAGSPEFVAWMEQQSPAMQAIIAPNVEDIVNGGDVAFVVERYKTDQGIVNGDGTDGASTAGQKNGQAKRKPAAADPVRTIQKRAAAAPRSSPGAVAREEPRQETEEEVRREILQAEQKRAAAEARA